MNKNKLKNSLITEDDFLVEKEFIIKNTNYNSCVEFYNSLGVYTVDDYIKMASNPNINNLIAKNSRFSTFNEFCDETIKFVKSGLDEPFKSLF